MVPRSHDTIALVVGALLLGVCISMCTTTAMAADPALSKNTNLASWALTELSKVPKVPKVSNMTRTQDLVCEPIQSLAGNPGD